MGRLLTNENNSKVAHTFCNTSKGRGVVHVGRVCIEMKI